MLSIQNFLFIYKIQTCHIQGYPLGAFVFVGTYFHNPFNPNPVPLYQILLLCDINFHNTYCLTISKLCPPAFYKRWLKGGNVVSTFCVDILLFFTQPFYCAAHLSWDSERSWRIEILSINWWIAGIVIYKLNNMMQSVDKTMLVREE